MSKNANTGFGCHQFIPFQYKGKAFFQQMDLFFKDPQPDADILNQARDTGIVLENHACIPAVGRNPCNALVVVGAVFCYDIYGCIDLDQNICYLVLGLKPPTFT